MTFNQHSRILLPRDFEDLRNLIADLCGLDFQEDSKSIFERRIFSRIQALNLPSPRDYYFFLKFSPKRNDELEKLINILTTNETYFFREKYQLRAFQEEILPEIYERKKRERKIRIWSAGCSTGEEPYTIAIILKEKKIFDNWQKEIFASDINTDVLQKARAGIYEFNSFRDTEPRFIKEYFRFSGGKYEIVPEIKNSVNFGKLNLLDSDKVKMLGPFDVVFCRNVLIYFTKEAKKKVVNSFFHALLNGGYLLLGHAESLINISSDFELVHLKSDIVYRKPLK